MLRSVCCVKGPAAVSPWPIITRPTSPGSDGVRESREPGDQTRWPAAGARIMRNARFSVMLMGTTKIDSHRALRVFRPKNDNNSPSLPDR